MGKISLLARAKANLSLGIKGKDKGGYHDLDMLIVSLADVYDRVDVYESDELRVTMDGKDAGENNTAYRAISLIREKYGVTLSVDIEKGIPFSAGLGGSSADASAVLFAYAKLYRKSLTEMIPLADKVGSDVAFMMFGGTAISRGRGSTLIFKHMPKLKLGVFKAFGGCDTGEVFRLYDDEFSSVSSVDNNELLRRINSGKEYSKYLVNDLFEPAKRLNSNVGEMYSLLNTVTPYTVMSGSGSSIITVVRENDIEKSLFDIGKKAEYFKMTDTASKGMVILGIDR